MASIPLRQICEKCSTVLGQTLCAGCQKWMCVKHLIEHRQSLSDEIDHLTENYDQLQRDLTQDTFDQHSLLRSINEWEEKSIERIRRDAERARQHLRKHLDRTKIRVQKSLSEIVDELQQHRQLDDYTEIELGTWTKQLQKFRRQLDDCSIVQIVHDQNEQSFVSKLILSTEEPDHGIRWR